MSIALIMPFAVGNAAQIILSPPAGAVSWRLLRKGTDDIADQNDPAAKLLFEGTCRSWTDFAGLENGTAYFYRVFYFNGSTWAAAPSRSVVPGATFTDESCDVLSLVRDRLELGLEVYLQRAVLTHALGQVPVLNAWPQEGQIELPMVTVHLVSDTPAERGLGEMMAPDGGDGTTATSVEGWLSNVQLSIIGWTGSSDVRAILRQAIKTLLIANEPIFTAAGMVRIDPSFSDQEDFDSYQSPMFQSICTFTCQAPSAVGEAMPAVQGIDTNPSFFFPQP